MTEAADVFPGPIAEPAMLDPATGIVRTLPQLAADEAAAAFTACRDRLPRGCERQDAWDTAWAILQEPVPEFMVLAVAVCQANGVPDDVVERTALAAGNTYIAAFFDLAEAWRVGGRA